ncbi:MAG: Na+/H+ antiporter NhaA [Dehalococcoidia bacterium]
MTLQPPLHPVAAAGRQFVRERFYGPAARFSQIEASGGIVLLVAAAVALLWANSPWDDQYFDLWHAHIGVDLNVLTINETVGHAVNDGLMAIFFFVVGLEIKRELVHGELASVRKATLPAAAALGGMIVPALIYVAFNAGGDGAKGWGIPMATDIAFAVGVLALLGRRAPFSLKVFLLALAIVDDLGAIVVIAVFYTDSISIEALLWAAGLAAVILAMGRMGVRSVDVYVVFGILFWLAVFESGIHATIAGVLLAMMTPSRPYLREGSFSTNADLLLTEYRIAHHQGDHDRAERLLSEFESLARDMESPLDRLEHTLHPWVAFLIVPIFALANSGVALSSDLIHDAATGTVSAGVFFGLVVGKPLGIMLACFIAVKLKIAELPSNTGYQHMVGIGLLGGVGFTVSLFITGLAFDSPTLIDEGKIGILAASFTAGLLGFIYLWWLPGEPNREVSSQAVTQGAGVALELSPQDQG